MWWNAESNNRYNAMKPSKNKETDGKPEQIYFNTRNTWEKVQIPPPPQKKQQQNKTNKLVNQKFF